MFRDLIAPILFTIAALAVINFVGDFAFTTTQTQNEEQTMQASAPEPEAEPKAEPEAQPEPQTEPAVEAQPAVAPETPAEPAPPAKPEPAAAAAVEAPVSQATALEGDADKGHSLFRKKCMVCHTTAKGDKDRTGPNLWSIVGRERASSKTFNYSNAMKMRGGTWSEADISSFIAGPRSFIPDTKMTFAGLKNAIERADIIAYLKTQTD
jgi:cytochrome c